MTPPPFSTIILGGTGQVGSAAVDALLATPECREVVMVTRKAIAKRDRVRNVVLDTSADDLAARVTALVRDMRAQDFSEDRPNRTSQRSIKKATQEVAKRISEIIPGYPAQARVAAVSCLGIGSGTAQWSEADMTRVEVGVVSAFARGARDGGIAHFCLLSAVGSDANSPFKYVRVMGRKEDAVRAVGFARLAIVRPGIITGNAHTPAWSAWLGALLPGGYGNIAQPVIGRAIAKEIALHHKATGEVIYHNADLRALAAA